MSAIVKGLKCAFQVVTPAFYKNILNNMIKSTGDSIRQNSIRPVVNAIAMTSVVGFTIKYVFIGKPRADERRAARKEAYAKIHTGLDLHYH